MYIYFYYINQTGDKFLLCAHIYLANKAYCDSSVESDISSQFIFIKIYNPNGSSLNSALCFLNCRENTQTIFHRGRSVENLVAIVMDVYFTGGRSFLLWYNNAP